MTNRVALPPQDFNKMCKQAERDQETRKLAVLIERVKRQIAERENASGLADTPRRPVAPISGHQGASVRMPSRSALFER